MKLYNKKKGLSIPAAIAMGAAATADGVLVYVAVLTRVCEAVWQEPVLDDRTRMLFSIVLAANVVLILAKAVQHGVRETRRIRAGMITPEMIREIMGVRK